MTSTTNLEKSACENINIKFKETYSTGDPNFFSAKGYNCVSIARGVENPHGYNEKVKVQDIIDCLDSLINFLKE